MFLNIQTAELTEVGGRDYNEDRLGLAWREGRLCCVVADGAGGHGGGDVAASLVVETVLADFERLAASAATVSVAAATRLLLHANDVVVEAQEAGGRLAQMRSTAIVLLLDPQAGQACWASCGDSRLYALRDGLVLARSRDQSLVQGLVDAGMIAPGDARHHPQRNVLLSALGAPEGVEVAAGEGPLVLQEGDAFLLCSDGVWEYLEDEEAAAAVWRAASPGQWLETLAERVRERARPGHDNYSAIGVWVGALDQMTRITLPRRARPVGQG